MRQAELRFGSCVICMSGVADVTLGPLCRTHQAESGRVAAASGDCYMIGQIVRRNYTALKERSPPL